MCCTHSYNFQLDSYTFCNDGIFMPVSRLVALVLYQCHKPVTGDERAAVNVAGLWHLLKPERKSNSPVTTRASVNLLFR
eukprot:COSAG01_NODE_311_length_19072_cov_73.511727_11_plen_79_part_00